MRYSKPLLVSDLPGSGMTWVARNGQNALHVRPEDPGDWRDTLRSVPLEKDDASVAQLDTAMPALATAVEALFA